MLVELALVLAPALALVLWLGLVAKRAASVAEATGEVEVRDDDGETDAEPDGDPEGEFDPEGDPDGEVDFETEPDGEGDAGPLLGLAVAAGELVVAAGEVGEPEAEGDGVGVGVFDGVGVGVFDGVGVGVEEGVLAAGSTWQLVSVFELALVEVPGLAESAVSLSMPACAVPTCAAPACAAPACAAPACAVPGRLASTPRVRKPPPSTLSAVTRTCARRMRIALSPLLVGVTVCS